MRYLDGGVLEIFFHEEVGDYINVMCKHKGLVMRFFFAFTQLGIMSEDWVIIQEAVTYAQELQNYSDGKNILQKQLCTIRVFSCAGNSADLP